MSIAIAVVVGLLIVIFILWFFWMVWKGLSCASNVNKDPSYRQRRYGMMLSGENEVPPVEAGVTGKGQAIYYPKERHLKYHIEISKSGDTDITAAHFHLGAAGENGPVIKDLKIKSQSCEAVVLEGHWAVNDPEQPLTQEYFQALNGGQVYVNAHTPRYPDGASRSQIVPLVV